MTDILRVIDILPDEAKHLAQKFHRKKDEIEICRKALIGDVEASVDEERTIVARVSTNDRDRDGEIVEPKGIELKDFQANPVLLWAHSYNTPPVGKALWSKTDDKGLVCKFQFAQTQFAEDIYQLYKGGYLRAFSIGFIATDFDTKTKTYNKISLLEVSAVPVPANQNALVMEAYAKGIVTSEALRKDFGLDEPAPVEEPAVEEKAPDAPVVEEKVEEAVEAEAKTDVPDEAEDLDPEVAVVDLAELDELIASVRDLSKRIDELAEKVEAKAAPVEVVPTPEPEPIPEPAPAPEVKSTITITAPEPVKSDAEVIAEYLKSKEFREYLQLSVDKAVGRVR